MRSDAGVRVIVDTNVLISGLISTSGAPARIVNAILREDLIPVMSQATFSELKEVLKRPSLAPYFSRAGVTPAALAAEFRRLAEFVIPQPTTIHIRDLKDRPFLDLAATRPPAEFIVTGDKDFESQRYGDVPVISASAFVKTVLKVGEKS
jgi:putative PIN family toxin of toxin-antitoxin system